MKDATYWIEELKNNRISHEELINDWARKVTEKNDELNAFLTFSPELAIREYQQQPDYYKDSLFGGLPVPLKPLSQSKKGWLDTSSSRLFKDNIASKTNCFVEKVEKVGMLPLGQTNAPEFGFKNITDPTLHGVTRNPWNLAYSPGGSSGGAAAVVASGMFPLALASDGGGSIRIPASFCGLIGLKPSRGTMPVGPGGWRGWQGASINFGLTVSIRDTKLLYSSLKGIHSAAPYQPTTEKFTSFAKPLTIAYCLTSPIGSQVSEEAKQALMKTVKELEKLGHQVTEINYPIDGIALMTSYYAMNGGETAAMFERIERGFDRKMTIDDMELMTWGIYQYGKKMTAAHYIESLQLWDETAFKMEELFESYDIFLTPTTATSAPKTDDVLVSDKIKSQLISIASLDEKKSGELIYEMFEKSLSLTPYTQLANLTGQPAISLPVHVTREGLPIGVQLMSSRGNDWLLLELSEQLEKQQLFLLPKDYR